MWRDIHSNRQTDGRTDGLSLQLNPRLSVTRERKPCVDDDNDDDFRTGEIEQ